MLRALSQKYIKLGGLSQPTAPYRLNKFSFYSEGIAVACDVTIFDQVVHLFQQAVQEYKAVDIVVLVSPYHNASVTQKNDQVVNAGVSEIGQFSPVVLKDGLPVQPDTTTLNVNLIGLTYSKDLGVQRLSQTHLSSQRPTWRNTISC